MTDFSLNQISSATYNASQVDRWVVPSDRQLSLRAKLGSGWCSRSNQHLPLKRFQTAPKLSEADQDKIVGMIAKAEQIEKMEQERIGMLVNRYENIKRQSLGNGETTCILCGEELKKKKKSAFCSDCGKSVCLTCSIETFTSQKDNVVLCRICMERRELWKRSGAWFFKELPPHIISDKTVTSYGRASTPIPCSQGSPKTIQTATSITSRSDQNISVIVHPADNNTEQTTWTKIPHGYESSSDDSDFTDDELFGAVQKNKKAKRKQLVEPDRVSVCSSHIKQNPLVQQQIQGSASSEDSVTQHSATESLQDLRKVAFNIDSSSGGQPSTMVRLDSSVPEIKSSTQMQDISRCFSIPDAHLAEVHYTREEDEDSPLGSIVFTMFYNEAESKLSVELLEAKHLPIMDANSSDPYVVLNVVPSLPKSHKLRSKTVKNSLEPKWNERLAYFGISPSDMYKKTLAFVVMDEDKIGSDDAIGQFRLPLRQINSYELKHYHVYLENYVPQASDELEPGSERGKILISLRYNSFASQLHVAIIRCAGLYSPSHLGYANPYVKTYLLPDANKSSKRKSQTQKKTLNPEFHDEFIYKCDLTTLYKKTLQITVWDHTLARNHCLGGITLDNKTPSETEFTHWYKTLQNPDTRQDAWHVLNDMSNTTE